ncbi:glycosyltransferase family 2 protein [Photobacterium nomapromontoriensis]|uniref:glycosyltransferase family 2 protein n=1 Tax=Photobacterium nomapromontoriensis TaxID=2910237 RepID=UPI003D0B2ED3
MMELISIIMPAFNAQKYISDTIESVISQTYDNWELIIVDDCSRDNTKDIIENFCSIDNRIHYYINDKNSGSAFSRNKALEKAKGRFIAFLDADDLWDNDFLKSQLSFLNKSNSPLVFSSYRRIDESGNKILKDFIVPGIVCYDDLLKTCSISCLTAVYDCDKIGKHYFDSSLGSLRDDYAMWLSILKSGIVATGNSNVLASYRVFSQSTTSKKYKMIPRQYGIYRNVEKFGLMKSLYYTFHWSVNGLIKYKR